MKQLVYFFFLLNTGISLAQFSPASLVNPFIGTGGHGHTFPGATVPFGMVQLSPDTRIDGSWDGCSGYHYSDSIIYGFSHTHLSGTGCSDYGDVHIMPVTDTGLFTPSKYKTGFSHRNEKAEPGYYQVKMNNDIIAELTTTTRCVYHKYHFPQKSKKVVISDIQHRDLCTEGFIKWNIDGSFSGYRVSKAWATNQYIAFYISPQQKVTNCIVWSKGHQIKLLPGDSLLANDFVLSMQFADSETDIELKVGISPVSMKGAKKNFETEIKNISFIQTKNQAIKYWNQELSKIELLSGEKNEQTIFYTALYHCFIQPNVYFDVDRNYRGRDNQIHQCLDFDYYTVFSLWDTFRAWHPLMTLIDQKRTADFVKTMLAQYKEGGLLPVWELSSNETECMIGYHAVSVIADATIKGIKGFSYREALESCRKSAESYHRFGLGAYVNQGFIAAEDESESVSKTLEYAYDDYCISQLAKACKADSISQIYLKRASAWKNLINKKSGYAQPRYNGSWLQNFDPYEVNNHFTEANSFQYSFFVPFDVSSLIEWNGGYEQFNLRLDRLFKANTTTSGRNQADITGLIGQYAHGNEPSHHMAYLYNYSGTPWKTQELTRKICNEFYKNDPDGLIGNEDCGQMSAWYVLSSLGLYQVCPGQPLYTLSSPVFDSVKIHLENSKFIKIVAPGAGNGMVFTQKIKQNNKILPAPFITYIDLMKGPQLDFTLADTAIKSRISESVLDFFIPNVPADCFQLSPEIKIESPNSRVFADSTKLLIGIENDLECEIFYTLDGSDPFINGKLFKNPVTLNKTTLVRAYSKRKDCKSGENKANFYLKPHKNWKIDLKYPYNRQYSAGGADGLIDGIKGEKNWRKGDWQGYQESDFESTITMDKELLINKINISFLQDTRSWIVYPKLVYCETSVDGVNFTRVGEYRSKSKIENNDVFIEEAEIVLQKPAKARYLRVVAENYGYLPEWHPGAGGKTFIFIDEINVQ